MNDRFTLKDFIIAADQTLDVRFTKADKLAIGFTLDVLFEYLRTKTKNETIMDWLKRSDLDIKEE